MIQLFNIIAMVVDLQYSDAVSLAIEMASSLFVKSPCATIA